MSRCFSLGTVRGQRVSGCLLDCCCCLLPAVCLPAANLRLLFTIIQSIIQFNARSSRPKSQFIQLFMHCADGTGKFVSFFFFSLLFFTFHCFSPAFSVYRVSLREFSFADALSLYTSSSSFTGPQMRHTIFLQLRMCTSKCEYFAPSLRVCACYLRRIVFCGEYKRFVYVSIF